MRRSMILLAALLGLLMAACAPSGTPAPAVTPPSQPTNGPAQLATAPQSTQSAVNTPEAAKPVATPDLAKIVKTQPDDWKHGPDGAKVTIIEWGDFQ